MQYTTWPHMVSCNTLHGPIWYNAIHYMAPYGIMQYTIERARERESRNPTIQKCKMPLSELKAKPRLIMEVRLPSCGVY